MVTKGLIVHLHARPGREEDVRRALAEALPLVQAEDQTIAWFAFRTGRSTFAIVDVFPDEAGRMAHLQGPLAAALAASAEELFEELPTIEHVDVLASKLPRHHPQGESL
jgi:quinol monooxygenase YgiN